LSRKVSSSRRGAETLRVSFLCAFAPLREIIPTKLRRKKLIWIAICTSSRGNDEMAKAKTITGAKRRPYTGAIMYIAIVEPTTL
jgi:hypothetical protein